ncbi:hypothetical protein C6N75_02965 [Streptomyces solincola]|uniref:Uncharacterized protein n=1 Tax=Streptomyces solincola TaxID=2100817 RepID=A0A2S9Q1V9_9ACTN|nr:hypothetical protein C6N75_02965 [Streptomyces solincola]
MVLTGPDVDAAAEPYDADPGGWTDELAAALLDQHGPYSIPHVTGERTEPGPGECWAAVVGAYADTVPPPGSTFAAGSITYTSTGAVWLSVDEPGTHLLAADPPVLAAWGTAERIELWSTPHRDGYLLRFTTQYENGFPEVWTWLPAETAAAWVWSIGADGLEQPARDALVTSVAHLRAAADALALPDEATTADAPPSEARVSSATSGAATASRPSSQT